MDHTPLVSVIIPVYNGSRYLPEAIQSALAQTYRNIEVLVVNDGSTDNGTTEAVARSFGQRICYYSKPNGGVSSALNHGIREMRGEYFSWLSHDDLYYPTKIKEQLAYLQDPNNNADIVYSDYAIINEHSEIIGQGQCDHETLTRAPLYGVLRLCIHGCSLLIPKECFCEGGLFDERLATTGDYDLWFKLSQCYRFAHIPRALIQSCCHDMQDSKKRPGHHADCDKLMIRMLRGLSGEQILACEPTAHAFYSQMAAFLHSVTFTRASEYAASCANEELESSRAVNSMSLPNYVAGAGSTSNVCKVVAKVTAWSARRKRALLRHGCRYCVRRCVSKLAAKVLSRFL